MDVNETMYLKNFDNNYFLAGM
jgi:Calpain family cysteine protease